MPSSPTSSSWAAGVDGKLIDEIKHDPSMRQIPVVVLTGHTNPSITREAERIGCVAVLTKPCLPEELANVLQRLLPAIG